eukprot:TRINITY_DN8008_c0_g1_i1.p1 TRINITY_DN8008_c0_g1~~TRINITY_DN8008_c0_g1_i1.p1  ORF type:complete len:322 (-),score=50.08 TRINITY_DN8008_c0_g1_i1:3-968(-)
MMLGCDPLDEPESPSQPPEPGLLDSVAGPDTDTEWMRQMQAAARLPLELQPRLDPDDDDDAEDELPPLSSRTAMRFFAEERKQAAGNIPQVVMTSIARMRQECEALLGHLRSLAEHETGLARAKTLRTWIEKQQAHLCNHPSGSNIHGEKLVAGKPVSWDKARADAYLSVCHLGACTGTEQKKAADCIDQLQKLYHDITLRYQFRLRAAKAKWAKLSERCLQEHEPDKELSRLRSAASALDRRNSQRRERLVEAQQSAEQVAARQGLRAINSQRAQLQAHLREARAHSRALGLRLQELVGASEEVSRPEGELVEPIATDHS